MPTYLIRDAEGREVRRETTLTDILAPAVRDGETAELLQEQPAQDRPAPKRAAQAPQDPVASAIAAGPPNTVQK